MWLNHKGSERNKSNYCEIFAQSSNLYGEAASCPGCDLSVEVGHQGELQGEGWQHRGEDGQGQVGGRLYHLLRALEYI